MMAASATEDRRCRGYWDTTRVRKTAQGAAMSAVARRLARIQCRRTCAAAPDRLLGPQRPEASR